MKKNVELKYKGEAYFIQKMFFSDKYIINNFSDFMLIIIKFDQFLLFTIKITNSTL